MSRKEASTSWDPEKFLKFLVSKEKISDRVARDYLSRCRRIETIFDLDLIRETKSTESCLDLIEKIASYAEENFKTPSEIRIFSSTLRLAAKKFALYSNGYKIKYPRVYRKIKLSK